MGLRRRQRSADNKEAIIQGIKNVIAPVAEFGDNTTTYHFKNQGGQPCQYYSKQ